MLDNANPLDVRALLLGAAAMTKRFMEEPFERNPVLQFAAVNFLMAQSKPMRVLSIWSKKLPAKMMISSMASSEERQR